jgi:anti-sigma regulatory factor (Ser/Thr protein kinase)
VFRNAQIHSTLLAILTVLLLVLLGLATAQMASSAGNLVEAERLRRPSQFASSVTALLDGLQRERAVSRGYVAGGKQAVGGTMLADRALSDAALRSFQRDRWLLDGRDVSAKLARDVDTAVAKLGDLTSFRSKIETQPVTTVQVAGWYGERIDALLAVISDLGSQRGHRLLGGNLDALAAAARAKEAASRAQGLLFSALTAGTFPADGYQQFASLGGEERADLARFRQAATPGQRELLDRALTGPDVERTEAMRQAALSARGVPAGIAAKDWFTASSATLDALHRVELRVAGDVARAGAAARSAAARRAIAGLAATALLTFLALGTSLLRRRSMARPLVALERRARRFASTGLPGVVARLQHAGGTDQPGSIAQRAGGEPPIRSRGRIGRLAAAFDSVEQAAVRLATDHAALRRSIGDMFVNLARRNQSLIERQLSLIEDLGRRTSDPDHLRELLQLDHLATRMRRNEENLLVLARAEPGRRRRQPIALADVVRAAASQVEDLSRIELRPGYDDLRVLGHAASDLVHLLGELIENAVTFSPPDTPVRVAAEPTAGGCCVEIEDRGLGMAEDQIDSVNERLANPPEIDFAISRMLGFFVVGRLADRHGIQVRLRPSWYGGITAVVLIPSSLLLTEPELTRSTAVGAAAGPVSARTGGGRSCG